MNGILSALIRDLDSDGTQELLTVRFTPGEEVRMYLEIYEAAAGAISGTGVMEFVADGMCMDSMNRRTAVFFHDGALYTYGFENGNGGGSETLRQITYDGVELSSQRYWTLVMGSDLSVSVQWGTVNGRETDDLVNLWDYDSKDVSESDYTDSVCDYGIREDFPSVSGAMIDRFYSELESAVGLRHKAVLPHNFNSSRKTVFAGYQSMHDLGMGAEFTVPELFDNGDDILWICGLDDQLYEDYSSGYSHTNTMVPVDHTGLVRDLDDGSTKEEETPKVTVPTVRTDTEEWKTAMER